MPSLRVPHPCLQVYSDLCDGEIFRRFRVCAYSRLDARLFRQIMEADAG